jgi:CDP-glucose 4,6-dehydratase
MEGMAMSFWKGKRVFLTGHTGFKGSWLSLWLQGRGAKVRGYALESATSPNLFATASVAGGMDSCIGDIRDYTRIHGEMADFKPEIAFHLAAQPLVRYSYGNPLETYSVNVMGTANFLEAARTCKSIRSIVVITTDKCYENKEWPWPYRENDRLGGYDPYSNSKACAELVVSAFRDSYFNPKQFSSHGVGVASARAGNVIGGGDWSADRLIPDIVRAFSARTPVRIRNPYAIRPWQHVLEPLNGYLMLAEALYQKGESFSGGWNFGPLATDAMPVGEIVDRMAKLWGEDASWQVDEGLHAHEANTLKLDCTKATEQLDWKPLLNIEEALALTFAWYEAWFKKSDERAVTLRQIEDYEVLAAKREDRIGKDSQVTQGIHESC